MNNLQKWSALNSNHIPRPLAGNVDEGWTAYSIAARLPEIGERVIKENSFPQVITRKIQSIIESIPFGVIRPIEKDGGGDWMRWNSIIEPYIGMNWLEAPWMFIEFYFYRLILDAIGYFNEGEYFYYDPFQFQKMEGFLSSIDMINALLKWLDVQKIEGESNQKILSALLYFILEGNRKDLSLWPVNGSIQETQSIIQKEQINYMLADDLLLAMQYLFSRKISRLDLLIDNAGFELLSDMCMIDFMLEKGIVEQAVLHVKPYPVFVSDVIRADVEKSVRMLVEKSKKLSMLAGLANRLSGHMEARRIKLDDDDFWAYPRPFWEMPNHLYKDLSLSDFIISKGDANYRRLLGDRRWDYQEPFAHVISYLPAALLAVRIVKSDVGAGYDMNRMNAMMKADPHWMRDGKWGTFQFFSGEFQDSLID